MYTFLAIVGTITISVIIAPTACFIDRHIDDAIKAFKNRKHNTK